jgi:hypothetical protein
MEEVEAILDWCFPTDLPSQKAMRRIEVALDILAIRRQQQGQ